MTGTDYIEPKGAYDSKQVPFVEWVYSYKLCGHFPYKLEALVYKNMKNTSAHWDHLTWTHMTPNADNTAATTGAEP